MQSCGKFGFSTVTNQSSSVECSPAEPRLSAHGSGSGCCFNFYIKNKIIANWAVIFNSVLTVHVCKRYSSKCITKVTFGWLCCLLSGEQLACFACLPAQQFFPPVLSPLSSSLLSLFFFFLVLLISFRRCLHCSVTQNSSGTKTRRIWKDHQTLIRNSKCSSGDHVCEWRWY